MKKVDTIVIGAGVSGLATAYYLKKLGQSVIVLDSASRPGGVLKRVVVEGVNLELGANSFLLKDELRPLLDELQIDVVKASEEASARYLFLESGSGYKLYKAPGSFFEVIQSGIISPLGKLRVPFELAVSRIEDDLSVQDFLTKRFGVEASKLGVTALNGIYAADCSKLSARSALPKIWELQSQYGSVIGGFLFNKNKKRQGKVEIVSFRGGMEELPNKLASTLKEEIRFNSQVEGIDPANGVQLKAGEVLNANNFVIANDSISSSKLLSKVSPEISKLIKLVPYVSLGILYVVGNKNDLKASLGGFGFLKQPKHGNSILGALYSSSLFQELTGVSKDQVLLTCFVGGGKNPELSDLTKEENAHKAFVEIRQDLGLGESFRVLHTHYWERAIPCYPVRHYKLKEQVQQLEKDRIFVASNWLEKPGLPDCIIRGKEIAQRIVN